MSIAALEPTASTVGNDENIRIELNNGVTFDADFETLSALQDKLSDRLSEAFDRRLEVRRNAVDPTQFGLIPVYASGAGEVNHWALPGAYGALPYGVPLIRFDRGNFRHYRWRVANKQTREDESWSLVFSNPGNLTLGTVKWDDVEGFARLATALRDTPLDALIVEASLLASSTGQTPPSRGSRSAKIREFIDKAVELPTIDSDVYGPSTGAHGMGLTISPLHILHPGLCRYVHIPGMVAVTDTRMNAPEVDKSLASVGLLGVPTERGGGFKYTRVSRIAVARGQRSRVGRIPGVIAEAVGNAHDDIARGENRQHLSEVALPDPMAFDEWQAALANLG